MTPEKGPDRKTTRPPRSCRFCGAPLERTFVDLGMSPLANVYLSKEDLSAGEAFYPLHVYVCDGCLLVQLEEFETPERIFSEYAYFSSFSETWLKHSEAYVKQMMERFPIGKDSLVVEVASNDGYLLKHFASRGVPVLGVEPAANVAEEARAQGVPTVVKFFGRETARDLLRQGRSADLLLGNNVLAHVPDLNDFVGGLKILLKPAGVLTMEFPHLLRMMEENQFDTIYHEHFSYFSFQVVEKVFQRHGLTLFDVDELPTHGGSLRVYGCHREDATKTVGENVRLLRDKEEKAGLSKRESYQSFRQKAEAAKRRILSFLIRLKEEGKSVVAYGAPAKGNTLLNYCGIRSDLIEMTFDNSPHKQGKFLPGTRIPIRPPSTMRQVRPDYVVILPWNIKEEIMRQFAHIREWGGRFVVLIPDVRVYP